MIFANAFYVGGGLIPDIGAVFAGGVIWLLGRIAKKFLSISTSPENQKHSALEQRHH
jgi:hypothetical protein